MLLLAIGCNSYGCNIIATTTISRVIVITRSFAPIHALRRRTGLLPPSTRVLVALWLLLANSIINVNDAVTIINVNDTDTIPSGIDITATNNINNIHGDTTNTSFIIITVFKQ